MTERVRVSPDDLRGAACEVAGERAHHLLRVSRIRAGDTVVAFDGEGCERGGRVARVGRGVLHLDWSGEARRGIACDAARVRWVQAVAKGEKMDTIIRQAVELGVAAVGAVFSERSIPQENPIRAAARLERWQRIAEEACRQCGRADVPTVTAPVPLQRELERDAEGPRVLLWESATRPLTEVLAELEPDAPITVMAGPEGGFGADEAGLIVRSGYVAASLGPRVLRAETVAPAALAILAALRGDLAGRAR